MSEHVAPTWIVAAASVQGTAHVLNDLPCQDASRIEALPDGWLLAVVSDGAGSAIRADAGASTACGGVAEYVQRAFDPSAAGADDLERLLTEAVGVAADRIRAQASQEGLAPRDFACTLLVLLVGPERSAIAHIGDGAIVARRGDVTGVVSWPVQGQFANETDFLTDDLALVRMNLQPGLPALDMVALFSDGLQHLLLDYAAKGPHLPFFERHFAAIAERPRMPAELASARLATYLASDSLRARADDDLTLVLAVRALG